MRELVDDDSLKLPQYVVRQRECERFPSSESMDCFFNGSLSAIALISYLTAGKH